MKVRYCLSTFLAQRSTHVIAAYIQVTYHCTAFIQNFDSANKQALQCVQLQCCSCWHSVVNKGSVQRQYRTQTSGFPATDETATSFAQPTARTLKTCTYLSARTACFAEVWPVCWQGRQARIPNVTAPLNSYSCYMCRYQLHRRSSGTGVAYCFQKAGSQQPVSVSSRMYITSPTA